MAVEDSVTPTIFQGFLVNEVPQGSPVKVQRGAVLNAPSEVLDPEPYRHTPRAFFGAQMPTGPTLLDSETAKQLQEASPLTISGGHQLTLVAAVHPGVHSLESQAMLPGNDEIVTGGGDDVAVGDNLYGRTMIDSNHTAFAKV